MSTIIRLNASTPALTNTHLDASALSSLTASGVDTYVGSAAPAVGLMAAGAVPKIGCYSDSGRSFYNSLAGEDLNPYVCENFRLIAKDVIRAGIKDIPAQSNGWCCGINSSARFLAMLGKPLHDYRRYHNDAPKIISRTKRRDQALGGCFNTWSAMAKRRGSMFGAM